LWKLQISLFGILFAAILIEVSIIPSLWAPLRVDFLIGMIIGQVIFIPFSQGFPFVILASLLMQAFTGARIGLIPFIYIMVFLVIDLLKSVIYLENPFTQGFLGMVFYGAITMAVILAAGTASDMIRGMVVPMAVGMVVTALITPLMSAIVGRLQVTYDAHDA